MAQSWKDQTRLGSTSVLSESLQTVVKMEPAENQALNAGDLEGLLALTLAIVVGFIPVSGDAPYHVTLTEVFAVLLVAIAFGLALGGVRLGRAAGPMAGVLAALILSLTLFQFAWPLISASPWLPGYLGWPTGFRAAILAAVLFPPAILALFAIIRISRKPLFRRARATASTMPAPGSETSCSGLGAQGSDG